MMQITERFLLHVVTKSNIGPIFLQAIYHRSILTEKYDFQTDKSGENVLSLRYEEIWLVCLGNKLFQD